MFFRRLIHLGAASKRPVYVDPNVIQAKLNKLDYFVERTEYGKSLPVYSNVTHNGLKISTIIRRIYGDIQKLRMDVVKVLPYKKKVQVEVREDLGQIRIKGKHVTCIKTFLTKQGF